MQPYREDRVLPRRLAHDLPEAERRRWRIVRLDSAETLPGLILNADCDTGACTLRGSDGELRDYSLGPGGLAIIRR
jgi:hypothetical protein